MKMSDDPARPKVIYIVGPTAVGKTDLSIRLAQAVSGEIISADSRCLYRGMDIGTAKPTYMDQILVPHHLLDVAEITEIWSLSQYKNAAIDSAKEIINRGKIPIFVGGTGQYYRALVQGWTVPQISPSLQLREQLTQWAQQIGAATLHEKLNLIDPEAASVNDPQNARRTIRALEVILTTGMKFSQLRTKDEAIFNFFVIGLQRARDELFERVDRRIDQMLKEGLIEEVKKLRLQGYTPDLSPMSAIGYREISSYLDGKIDIEEAVLLMRRNTRSFIRHQANWFKQVDPVIHWYPVVPDPLDAILIDFNKWSSLA